MLCILFDLFELDEQLSWCSSHYGSGSHPGEGGVGVWASIAFVVARARVLLKIGQEAFDGKAGSFSRRWWWGGKEDQSLCKCLRFAANHNTHTYICVLCIRSQRADQKRMCYLYISCQAARALLKFPGWSSCESSPASAEPECAKWPLLL